MKEAYVPQGNVKSASLDGGGGSTETSDLTSSHGTLISTNFA